MSSLKAKFAGFLFVMILLSAVGAVLVYKYYDYVFSKTVTGEVVAVKRVNTNETIIMGGANIPASQIFSFAVAIQDSKGEIHTASSEDRQWAVVERGKCAEAKFYPYPPWDLQRGGTYHGARLIRLFDCPGAPKTAPKPKDEAPEAEEIPAPSISGTAPSPAPEH